MKIKSWIDSNEAVLIYTQRLSPQKQKTTLAERLFCRPLVLASRSRSLSETADTAARVCLEERAATRRDHSQAAIDQQALLMARYSWRRYTHRLLAVCLQMPRSKRNNCGLSAGWRKLTFVHRMGFYPYSCIESASPACHIRENDPATESSGDKSSQKALLSTSHRLRFPTFRYRCINVIANARVCARSSSLFPSIDRCFSVWFSPIKMYVYLVTIASKAKRFSVKSKRMRRVQRDGPRAFDVSCLQNDSVDSHYFH